MKSLLLLTGPLLVAGCGSLPATSVSAPRASASAGDVEITGAYVGDDGATGYRPVYLTLHDSGPDADQLEAVIAPLATSMTVAVARHTHTPAEIAAYAEPCGADPRLLAMSAAALAASGDVLLTPGGTTWLTPGVGRLQLNGVGALRVGSTVPMTLYFASGTQVSLDVPVVAGRQTDPVPAP